MSKYPNKLYLVIDNNNVSYKLLANQNQKAIECLMNIRSYLCAHIVERYGYDIIMVEPNYVFKLIDDKIKELEEEK